MFQTIHWFSYWSYGFFMHFLKVHLSNGYGYQRTWPCYGDSELEKVSNFGKCLIERFVFKTTCQILVQEIWNGAEVFTVILKTYFVWYIYDIEIPMQFSQNPFDSSTIDVTSPIEEVQYRCTVLLFYASISQLHCVSNY